MREYIDIPYPGGNNGKHISNNLGTLIAESEMLTNPSPPHFNVEEQQARAQAEEGVTKKHRHPNIEIGAGGGKVWGSTATGKPRSEDYGPPLHKCVSRYFLPGMV